MNWLEWLFLFLAFVTAIVGFSLSWNPFLIFVAVFVVMMLGRIPRFYYYYFCRDAEKVKQYLMRAKNEAFHAYYLSLMEEDYETAHKMIHRYKGVSGVSPLFKKILLAQVFFGQGKWSQAVHLIEEINQPKYTHLLEVYMALAKDDVSTLEELKTRKVPTWQKTIYETELAFTSGRFEEAERLGELAIQQTKGLQRYSLVEARRLQEQKKDRRTFF